LKSRSVPKRDVGIIVVTGPTTPLAEIDYLSVLKSHVTRHGGGAKGESNVILFPEMFFDERSEREIGQDIAAVNEEGLSSAKETFGIFDSASGLKQALLVEEGEWVSSIRSLP
jgi:hypothetical protein